jgi:hypothetical protein
MHDLHPPHLTPSLNQRGRQRRALLGAAAAFGLWSCRSGTPVQWVLGRNLDNNWLLRAYTEGVYPQLALQLGEQQLLPISQHDLNGWQSALFVLPAALAGQTLAIRLLTASSPLGEPLTLPLPLAAPSSEHTLYLGACLQKLGWFGREPILSSIIADARQQPNPAMVWLGDHLYLNENDLSNADAMCSAYQRHRQHAALSQLLTAMPHYALWDDHDFGLNDADSSAPSAALAQQVFPLMWANPPSNKPYFAIKLGNTRLIFTDNRSARRTQNVPAYQRRIFGTEQLRWMAQQAQARDVRHTLLLGGSQWWVGARGEEGWPHASQEQYAWQELLTPAPPSRLLYISGDRHHSAEFTRQIGSQTVHELTSSALTSAPEPAQTGYAKVQLRQFFSDNNYLRIKISANTLSWQWFGADGQPLGPVAS